MEKDSVLSELIPSTIVECALKKGNNGTCVTNKEVLFKLKDMLSITDENVMEAAKDKLNCHNERCVIEKTKEVLGNLYLDTIRSFKIK